MELSRAATEQQLVVALRSWLVTLATLWHGIFYENVQISISNAITEASKCRAAICVCVCAFVCVSVCVCYCYSHAALYERMSARRGGATEFALCGVEAFTWLSFCLQTNAHTHTQS